MSTSYNTRLQLKNDIEANWMKAVNFTPLLGEIIIYNPDQNHPFYRFKVGDGSTLVSSLPFVESNYKLPVGSDSVLGGVKSGTDIVIDAQGNVSVKDNSHSHTVGNVTGLSDLLDSINTVLEKKASNIASNPSLSAATAAAFATKLTNSTGTELLNAGDEVSPVYIASGVPVECKGSLITETDINNKNMSVSFN